MPTTGPRNPLPNAAHLRRQMSTASPRMPVAQRNRGAATKVSAERAAYRRRRQIPLPKSSFSFLAVPRSEAA